VISEKFKQSKDSINQENVILEKEISLCPVCQEAQFLKFAEGYDYELQTCSNKWVLVKCCRCGHCWLNPRPAISEIYKIYPENYYAYSYSSKVNAVAKKAKQVLDAKKLQKIFKQRSKKTNSFLDIGCGEGRFLDAVQKYGLDKKNIYGIELDTKVVKELKSKGYQIFQGRVEDCNQIPESYFDLITMFHVIEHVDDPDLLIKKIYRWLSPGGTLVIETPNINSWDAKLFRNTFWGGYHFPRHWNIFSQESLTQLLLKNKLLPKICIYLTGHSFWMYSFHHLIAFGPFPNKKIAKLFDPLKGSLFVLAAVTLLDLIRSFLGFRTSSLLVVCFKKP